MLALLSSMLPLRHWRLSGECPAASNFYTGPHNYCLGLHGCFLGMQNCCLGLQSCCLGAPICCPGLQKCLGLQSCCLGLQICCLGMTLRSRLKGLPHMSAAQTCGILLSRSANTTTELCLGTKLFARRTEPVCRPTELLSKPTQLPSRLQNCCHG